MGNEMILYIKDPEKDLPRFMKTKVGNKEESKANWQHIVMKDKIELENYMNRMLRKNVRHRDKKRKIDDLD